MFSDVSGILKYQERREQTRRRLESTEQDVLRLEDIIHEMQRSSRRLKRQVRQTKLYKELKEEYKLLSLFTLKKEHDKTLEEFNKIQEQINSKDTHGQSILQEIKRLLEVKPSITGYELKAVKIFHPMLSILSYLIQKEK